MKFTPLLAFIIILVVLIITFFLSKGPIEPFISYNYSSNSNINTNQVNVPPYSTSRSIYKVYDSIYFDPQNGNVITLFGTPYTNNVDTTGQSLTNMILMPRTGSLVAEYDSQNNQGGFRNVAESKYLNESLSSSYTSWYYPNPSNTSSKLASSIEYQVFCFPWKNDTALFLNNIMQKSTVGIFSYNGSNNADGIIKTVNYSGGSSSNSNGSSGYNSYMNNGATIPGYNGSVGSSTYIVYNNVWFDTKSGTIIYQGNGNSSVNTDTSLQTGHSNRNYTILYNGSNVILGIPFSSNRSMVVVLGIDSSNPAYLNILNVVRFDPNMPNGIDGNNNNNSGNSQSTVNTFAPATAAPSTCGSGFPSGFNPNDYISKTQIVPPVCPQCPALPSFPTQAPVANTVKDVLTTLKDLGVIGVTPAPAPATAAPIVHVDMGPPTTNPGWGLANNIINQTGNIVTNAENVLGSTASNLISGATNLGVGAENVIGGAVSNVSNVANNVVSGATAVGVGAENVIGNTAKDVVRSTTALGLGAENVIGGTVKTAGELVGKTVTSAENVIGSSVIGAENVVGSSIAGATNLVGGTVNTAGNIIGGTINAAGGAVNTAGQTVSNVVTGAEQAIGNIGAGSSPVQIAPMSSAVYQGEVPVQTQPVQTQPVQQVIPIEPIREGGHITVGRAKAPEEEYEYVYEEVVTEEKPTPQVIIVQAPTPSLALMPTMPPMPTEEIYECEDDYYEEEDDYEPRPRRNKRANRERQEEPPSRTDTEAYKYYYNLPPGPGANGYYGAITNRNTGNDFMPMSSDLSRFGR